MQIFSSYNILVFRDFPKTMMGAVKTGEWEIY
jgi:hypothetical protein